jgi:adenylylsulfate kinase
MSWAIWITGPPGSGKSTLARLAAGRLAAVGAPATVLELDRLRAVITPQASYADVERDVVYRALVFIATALVGAGQPVIIDATGHRREWRDLARACLTRFAEVQLECPLALCRAREEIRPCGFAPEHIYAAAGRPGARVPGVDVAYEPPAAAELVIDTAHVGPEAAADRLAAVALTLERAAPNRRPAGPGAVIWLSGPPGSGKTTLASRVAEALAADDVTVAIVDWHALRAMVLAHAGHARATVELAHRALACTAAELAAAGVTAVVDAATPRRTRELARSLVSAFGEVQLICPAHICAERERVVRWLPHFGEGGYAPLALPRLGEGGYAAGGGVEVLEWPVECEYALNPELLVDTAVRSEWTAAEDILGLARRLLAYGDPRGEPPMRVRDLMTAKPITVDPETPMLEARQRMVEERIRHLIVTEDGRIVGIVTDRDIRLNLPSPATSLSVWEVNYLLARLTVRDVMTRAVIMVDPARPAAEAARIMLTHKISALPVAEGDQLVGIVTESDFVRVVAKLDGAA